MTLRCSPYPAARALKPALTAPRRSSSLPAMPDPSNRNHSGRNHDGEIGPLIGVIILVAGVLIGTATFLSFLGTECARGTPHLTPVFVCFPGR
jgi:hypothetical protein